MGRGEGGSYVHMSTNASWGQKGHWILQLELEWLWAAWRGHWEPNLGGLQEQTAFEPHSSLSSPPSLPLIR